MVRDFHILGRKKGWGCALALTVCTGQVSAEAVTLPSGLPAVQHELVFEPHGVPTDLAKTIRLRFVADDLANRDLWGFDRIEGDFEALCRSVGLDIRKLSAPNAERVIISIASEPTKFGDSVPNVVQYFDSFLIEGNACIWEGI